MPDLKIGATVDLGAANAALQESQQSVQQYCDRMNVSFQTVSSSSQRFSASTRTAFGRIGEDVKAAADSVDDASLRVARATQASATAQLQLRAASRFAKDDAVDQAQATKLLAAAQENARQKAAELAAAQGALSEAQEEAELKAFNIEQQRQAQSVVQNAAASGGGADDALQIAYAASTQELSAAKAQLAEVTAAAAAADLDEETNLQALAAAQARVATATEVASAAKAALQERAEAAALALEQERIQSEANAAVTERAAAANGVATEGQTRYARAALEKAAAQAELRSITESLNASTADEATKQAALLPALERNRLATLELATAERELSGASHDAVTGTQATSGALRLFEGNGGIRAIEKFIATTLGLGGVMQALFPIIGALGLAGLFVHMGEEAYEAGQKATHAGEEIARLAGEATQKLSTQNDELALTNSRLQDEIDKLSGHPSNGLNTALDEAIVRADKLQNELKEAAKAAVDLFTKETTVGALGSLISGAATTGPAKDEISAYARSVEEQGQSAQLAYSRQLLSAKQTYKDQLIAAGQNAEARLAAEKTYQSSQETAAQAHSQRMETITGQAQQHLADRAQEYRKKQQQEDAEYAASQATSGSGFGPNQARRTDYSDRVNAFEGASNIYAQVHTSEQLTATNAQLEQQKAGLEQRKSLSAEGRKQDEADRKADEARYRAMEEHVSEWKQLTDVTATAEYAYWQAQIGAFSSGSQQYMEIQRRLSALAVEGARKAHETIEKFRANDEKGDAKGSEVETRTLEALGEMAKVNGENAERAGKRWDEYWASVAKGSETQANSGAQMDLERARVLEAEGGLTRLGLLQVEAGIHAEEHRRRLVALNEELDRLNREATRDPFTGQVTDPQQAAKIQSVQNQIGQEKSSTALQSFQDNSAIVQEMSKPYVTAFNTIETSWMSTQRAILTGQRSIGAAFRQMGDSLAMGMIEGFEKAGAAFVRNEIMMTGRHAASKVQQTSIDAATAATSSSIAKAQNAEEGLSAAKTAAKNTYKVVSGWPVVGPILAPVAAGAAFAAVEAFEMGGVVMGLPGAAVPIVAHAGERVLTVQQTSQFHQMLEGGGGSPGENHFHLGGNTFHGSGSDDFGAMLDRHEGRLVGKIKSLHRDGKLNLGSN